jgi:hypothetical protein
VDGRRQSCCFFIKNSLVERKCENVRYRDAAASSFVAKVQGGRSLRTFSRSRRKM